MPPNSDKNREDEFLKRAIRGDKEGLAYLVRAYQNMAYTIAKRIVLNSEDAEEVVQDSFMKAFAALGNFRRSSKFSTWLYRIVYNTALTRISSKQIPTVGLDDASGNDRFVDLDDLPLDRLRHQERKQFVDMAITRLSQEDRLIITLHYIGELTVSEICQIVDMKKSAVKMRLLRGRDQLKTELEVLLKQELPDLL
jgi:RNA polymerase sigma factor (sigma-70 family)